MVELFLDTASVKEIQEIMCWGVFSGVTTNQKIFSNEKGVNFHTRVNEILKLMNGRPVSLELTKTDATDDDLINEAVAYSQLGDNIYIKVPKWGNGRGLYLISRLSERKIKTNATALMSTAQVLLAAKAGADYVSIFYNRVKDAGGDPDRVLKESRQLIPINVEIIAGSIRKPEDIIQAAIAGANIVTVPHKILKQMPYNESTEKTILEFDMAWREFKAAEVE